MNPKRTWLRKFVDAGRGVWLGVAGERSFVVHIPCALLVVAAAALLQVALWEWCTLLACIFGVLSLELINSSIESLAQAVDRDHNPTLGKSLDIASGAVLVASAGAALIGAMVLVPKILRLFSE